jgi:large subunit ribosomal protein L5
MSFKNLKLYKLSLVSNISKGENLESCKKFFENSTKYNTQYTLAKKTIHNFGIRRSQKIGFKLLLYTNEAVKFLSTFQTGLQIKNSAIGIHGGVNIGVHEYYQTSLLLHNPDQVPFGFSLNIIFSYDGYSMRYKKRTIAKKILVDKAEIINYIRDNFKNLTIV